jgi:hypothetical protein
LYCIVLYCIVLYCIVLYCIVLYCIVLYCIAVTVRTHPRRSCWEHHISQRQCTSRGAHCGRSNKHMRWPWLLRHRVLARLWLKSIGSLQHTSTAASAATHKAYSGTHSQDCPAQTVCAACKQCKCCRQWMPCRTVRQFGAAAGNVCLHAACYEIGYCAHLRQQLRTVSGLLSLCQANQGP